MKPNELRIGNLFKEKFSGKILHVEFLSKENIVFSGSFEKEWQAEPIPLSRENLTELGWLFQESIKHYFINWGKNGTHFIKKSPEYSAYAFQLGLHNYKVIEYVHELQNLFFALTGTELTYKP